MAIIFDDTKPITAYLKAPEKHPESFAAMCKRQAAGLKLISDEMEQEKKEQAELRKLQESRFERKKKLLFDNLDLILRHRDEILATPRYANIDAHYAIKGGGCYVGPISIARQYNISGTLLTINLKLGALLEIWDADQFKVECKCGGTAVIRFFSGSPLSGGSIASAVCPKCKEEQHNIRNRRFGGYMSILNDKCDAVTEMVVKNIVAKWTLAEVECQKKLESGRYKTTPGGEFYGGGDYCDLETMINELRLKEFNES